MKVRILGCGTSTGVPQDRQRLGPVRSRTSRATARLRTSILVESDGERMLVDCGPDLRQQLLAAEVNRLDGVIVTHDHGDHCHGIDELRPVSQAIERAGSAPCARATCSTSSKLRFDYAFAQSDFYRPIARGA